MSALTPIGRPGQVQRRERADRRQGQGEQDDEWRDERVEGQHHHHVDEQDGDAHRCEEAAERLGLLLGHAGELGRRAGRERAGGRQGVEVVLDGLGHGAGVVTGDLGRDRCRGPLSIREMLPWTMT